NNSLNYLIDESYNINQSIKNSENINTDELKLQIDNFEESWTQKENLLCLVINHKEIERIGEQITKLKVLIDQNKKEEAEYESSLLYFYAESYEHVINTSFQNIF
ncbi:MAG: DUF4363 family protein, partial [Clostridiales bacterium]|nr:DUF4363 family protein [Candidatus Apopatousia equi]